MCPGEYVRAGSVQVEMSYTLSDIHGIIRLQPKLVCQLDEGDEHGARSTVYRAGGGVQINYRAPATAAQ